MIKNEKMIKIKKFYRSQINLVKMSNKDLRVLNEECNVKNVNKMK